MLRLTLEYIPSGDQSRATEIGRMDIANESGLAPVSNYSVAVCTNEHAIGGETMLHGEVIGHERQRPVWHLVLKSLLATVGRSFR